MLKLFTNHSVNFDKLLLKSSEGIDKFVKQFTENLANVSKNLPPLIESNIRYILPMIELAFGPKQILYYVVIIIGLQTSTMALAGIKSFTTYCISLLTVKGRTRIKLLAQLEKASSYEEWKRIASELDKLRGYDEWRKTEVSSLYDYRILKKRISDTIQMINQGDIFNLIFRMRGGLARDQFGILHEALFTKAMAGTKYIIEDYHDTVTRALDFICDSPIADDEIPTDAKLAFFNETRHAYGRTALILSGGAYLGFYHAGLARALWRQRIMPRVISGASAGSLTAICLGISTNDELDSFLSGKQDRFRNDYLKQDNTIDSSLGRHLQQWTPKQFQFMVNPILSMVFDNKINLIDKPHFIRVLKNNMGSMTFQEAFDRTGRIINITVAPKNDYDPPRLLNYLTAPHVCLWSAAAASCAIPGVFDSSVLYVKETNGDTAPEHEWSRAVFLDPGLVTDNMKSPSSSSSTAYTTEHVYSDGSFDADLPMQQLSELFNVNHFIISQANIHSALLTSLFLPSGSSKWFRLFVSYVRFLKAHVRDWCKNIISMITHHSDLPQWGVKRGVVQALLQDHEGREKDITIMPWKGHINLFQACTSLLRNFNDDEFQAILDAGESRTWPFIARIKAHCSVEQTLDKCVQKLRQRLAKESHYRYETRQQLRIEKRKVAAAAVSVGNNNNNNNNNNSSISSSHDSDSNGSLADVFYNRRSSHSVRRNRSNSRCTACQCLLNNNKDDNSNNNNNNNSNSMNRVPSFYTTRSILNLSGLSVADPIVAEYETDIRDHSSSDDRRSSSYVSRPVPTDSVMVNNTNSSNHSGNKNNHTSSKSPKNTSGSSSGKESSPFHLLSTSSGDSSNSGAGVMFKSTKMSNFYYKRSKSEEALSHLQHHPPSSQWYNNSDDGNNTTTTAEKNYLRQQLS